MDQFSVVSELLEVSAIKAAETGSRAIKPETIREAVALDAEYVINFLASLTKGD
jgi:hypothetical protein